MAVSRSSVKSVDHQVKESIKKIPEEDLRWLSLRLRERIGSDLAEVLLKIQENYGDLNRILSNTPNAEAVYDVTDIIDKHIQDEIKRRSNYRPSKESKEVKDK